MSEKVVVKASMSSDELRAMRQQIREMETQAREREKEQRAQYRQAIRDFSSVFFGKLGFESAEEVKALQEYLTHQDTIAELRKIAEPVAETEIAETTYADYGQAYSG